MRKALIAVQADQFSDTQIQALDRLIHTHFAAHVSNERLLTIWNKLPAGQAFTDYKDSRSSMITVECPNDFAQEKRIRMLTAMESDWRWMISRWRFQKPRSSRFLGRTEAERQHSFASSRR